MTTLGYENVDAEMAADLLAKNTLGNRSVSGSQVSRYARAMVNGKWASDSPQGVSVGSDGNLYDGQHRLQAVLEANILVPGIQVRMMVARGVSPETFRFLDDGRPRTASSFVTGSFSKEKTALARFVMTVNNAGGVWTSSTRNQNMNNHEVLEFLDNNPRITEYVSMFGSRAKKASSAFRGTHGGALLTAGYVAGLFDPEKSTAWWAACCAVAKGDGLPDKHPVKALYRCKQLEASKANEEAYRRAIYAGRKFQQNEPLQVIRQDHTRKIQLW